MSRRLTRSVYPELSRTRNNERQGESQEWAVERDSESD
jgi:hypothetical protein